MRKPSTAFAEYNPRRSASRTRGSIGAVAAVLWFLISVYPVYNTYLASPGANQASAGHRAHPALPEVTVTETVLVPLIQPTALPGALPPRGYNPDRIPDAIDTFKTWNKRENCSVSSLELHGPFEPLCRDKHSLLRAMSEGGRLGLDAPFSPRGCDMRWFDNDEICAILSRFQTIYIVGDSMMRNLAVALHVYLRRDLVHGGHATWRTDPPGLDCSCQSPYETSRCGYFSIVNTRMAREEEPDSLFCSSAAGNIEFDPLLEYPIRDSDMQGLQHNLPSKRGRKPSVFIFGHGLWNDLNANKTKLWYEQAVEGIVKAAPFLHSKGAYFPKLFIAPNAAGPKKPSVFLARQGNLALARFENELYPWAEEKGLDFLGTYNMSIQATNPDGTHGGMKTNLIKAMMVLNWLNALPNPDV